MPVLVGSQAMTANQRGLNIFAGWQYEFAPYAAMVKLLIRATTAGVLMALYTGSDTIQESSPVQGGGPITELAARLLPVINLEQERPAYAIYKSELLWFVAPGQTAAVGNNSHCGVRNPPGSGLIVVLEQFAIDTAAIVDIRITAHA